MKIETSKLAVLARLISNCNSANKDKYAASFCPQVVTWVKDMFGTFYLAKNCTKVFVQQLPRLEKISKILKSLEF
jgi:hypothetical protein